MEAPPLGGYRPNVPFVDELFDRIDRLQSPGYDPKWKDVNPAARVPGLVRFQAAQEWLDRNANAAVKASSRP